MAVSIFENITDFELILALLLNTQINSSRMHAFDTHTFLLLVLGGDADRNRVLQSHFGQHARLLVVRDGTALGRNGDFASPLGPFCAAPVTLAGLPATCGGLGADKRGWLLGRSLDRRPGHFSCFRALRALFRLFTRASGRG